MKRQTVLAGLTIVVVLTLVSACQQDPQMIKRAQLVGYENRQLKKQIEQKNSDVADMKKQVEQAQQKIQGLQEQLDRATALTKQTADENKQLQKQSLQKDAEITSLTRQVNTMSEENMRSQEMLLITQLMESLSECQKKLVKYEPDADAGIPAEPNQ